MSRTTDEATEAAKRMISGYAYGYQIDSIAAMLEVIFVRALADGMTADQIRVACLRVLPPTSPRHDIESLS